jgi:hypothetical protein
VFVRLELNPIRFHPPDTSPEATRRQYTPAPLAPYRPPNVEQQIRDLRLAIRAARTERPLEPQDGQHAA